MGDGMVFGDLVVGIWDVIIVEEVVDMDLASEVLLSLF
jgi:hypothetical protein